jgi:hypothetical protein
LGKGSVRKSDDADDPEWFERRGMATRRAFIRDLAVIRAGARIVEHTSMKVIEC